MSTSGTSEVPALATASTSAAESSERTARGVMARNVDNATTKKGGKKGDVPTTRRRRTKVEATIDASLKWQPKESIFDVIPEHHLDDFAASTRKAWFETPDQGIDVGGYRARVACKELLSLAIFSWTDPRGAVTTVIREQIPASGKECKTLDKGPVARRVELAVDKGMASDPMRAQPPKHLVMFRMAQIVLRPGLRRKGMSFLAAYVNSKCGQKGKEKSKFFGPYYEALDGLWRKRDTWPTVEAEFVARSEEVKEAMKTLEKIWKPIKATTRQYEQFDRDEVAAADPSILIPVPDDAIHITIDCDGRVLTFRWPRALQWFFGDDLVDKTGEHIEEYSRHHLPLFPDARRHAMNSYWCRKHPEFQQKNKERGAKKTLGVFHFGCGGEQGNKDKKPMTKQDSRDDKLEPEVLRIREEMMREGVMPWITRAHKFVQAVLDPELLAAQLKVVERYEPEIRRPTIDEDPFALRAILVNALTTDHRDKSDWKNGLALMTPAGPFTEGDLCYRQLAVRVACGAGTIVAVRGGETSHSTTEWQGESRYCVVHTCGEQLRAWVKREDEKAGKQPTESAGEMGGSEERKQEEVEEEEEEQEEDEEEERGENEDEEEETTGTAQNPIELLWPSDEEDEGDPVSRELPELEVSELAEAAGTVQDPIELYATPSPVSKKRKREP